MADRALEWIDVDGFTSIRSARVPLGHLNVLVGANGAGKSNFIRVFELLGRIVDQELGLYVGLNGGASTLMNISDESDRIRLRLHAEDSGYEVRLVSAARDELIFAEERVEAGVVRKSFGSGHRETFLHESVRSPIEDSVSFA